MKRSLSISCVLLVLSLLANTAGAATAAQLVPQSGPRGARCIVVGTGLDAPGVTVSFPTAGPTRAIATIASRSAEMIDLSVPRNAVTGSVQVSDGSTLLGSFPFSVQADPQLTTIGTLVVAGSGRQPIKGPVGNAVAPDGSIFLADTMHHQIKRVTVDGTVTVFAGSGRGGLTDGVGTAADLRGPQGVAYDATRGVLYVADTDNHAIRRVTLDGSVTTIAGSGRRGDAEGTGTAAEFTIPGGIAVDALGNVYVADTGNHRIKRIAPDGVVTTLAGNGRAGSADGGQAQFRSPEGIAVAADGTIYIADTGNDVIRKLAGGVVTTIAGGARPGYIDGPAMSSSFAGPRGLTLDEIGNLVIADTRNHVVRRLTLTPGSETVSTLAGSGTAGHTDGPVATAQFRNPSSVSLAGLLFVSDTGNDALRVGYLATQLSATYPRRGKTAGGDAIRLFGTGFVPGRTSVTFGGQPATAVEVVSSTLVVATTPGGASHGLVDVAVTTPGGTATLPNSFFSIAPPMITSLQPAIGPSAGGMVVLVRGTNFLSGETEILFDQTAATNVTWVDSTSIQVTTPAHASGIVDVTVKTPGGTSTRPSAFLYRDPPVIVSFAPGAGPGGTVVTIVGQNFDPLASGNTVLFGAATAQVVSASATQLVAIAPENVQTGRITVTTNGGTGTSSSDFLAVTVSAIVVSPTTATVQIGQTTPLTASATLSNGGTIDVTNRAVWSSTNPTVATVTNGGVVQGLYRGRSAITASLSGVSGSASLRVRADETIPPDPLAIAPQPNPAATMVSVADSVSFLYSGPSPVQRGVQAGAIRPRQAGVVRGRVLDAVGQPLPGAFVAIHDHPELGYTISRADGRFDLVANGGGSLIVEYDRDGYLPAQRQLDLGWGAWSEAPDVMLLAVDPKVTAISLTTPAAMQTAQATRVVDSDGARTATILFPAGTTASLTFADGTTQPLNTLSVRATEYTVGANGPKSMPAALPPSSGYTYAVELSVDEAVTMGAAEIRFNQPLPFYLDNFLGFPVGSTVPAGYYDRNAGEWVPSDDGVVLKILGVANGTASLDTNGDGAVDDTATLTALGITSVEQQRLATLYGAGQTLWRVPVAHFTPWDFNWPFGPPSDAVAPPAPIPQKDPGLDNCNVECGSELQIENRTLGEAHAIAGTPFRLHYSSDRVLGRTSASTVQLPISGPSVPASLLRIEVRLSVGGTTETRTFTPAPNLKTTFTWSGKDAYGRTVRGQQPITVTTTFVYPGTYQQAPEDFSRSFARVSGFPLAANRARQEISLERTVETKIGTLGPYDGRTLGFGGWSVSAHHVYDAVSGKIYRGDGSTQSDSVIVSTVAGKNCISPCDPTGDSGPATGAQLKWPIRSAFSPDGTMYVGSSFDIRKIDPDGIITTIDTSGAWQNLTVDSDGVLYATRGQSIHRREPNGTWTEIANFNGYLFDYTTPYPDGLAIGPDGAFYFPDGSNYQIFRVGKDGRPVPFAGRGCAEKANGFCAYGFDGDGGPATQALLGVPADIAFGSDGSLYVADPIFNRVRKITPDGIIRTVAGKGCISSGTRCFWTIGGECQIYVPTCEHPWPDASYTPNGDGGPATEAYLSQPHRIAIGPDGSLFLQESSQWQYTRRVAPDGTLSTILGTGPYGFGGDDGPARAATTGGVFDLEIGPDGDLYVADPNNGRVRRIALNVPGAKTGERRIASSDGTEMFVFDGNGRHLRTLDALTGSVRFQFGYTDGWLTSITDGDNNVARIERTGPIATAIVAPGGQRTTLTTNGSGYLETITHAGEQVRLGYGTDGLLTSFTNPRDKSTIFSYDTMGRLESETDGATGTKLLAYITTTDSVTATVTTGLGRTTSYVVRELPDRSVRRVVTTPEGLGMTATETLNGTTTVTSPDGMTVTTSTGPDSRFGMHAPLVKSLTVRLPSGLTSSQSVSETTTLTNPTDPLSVSTKRFTVVTNGRTSSSTYEAATRKVTDRSAAGRVITRYLDERGRERMIEIPGLMPYQYTYDSAGRLTHVSHGSRGTAYAYNDANQLTSVTDALHRTTTFEYDAAGRLKTQILPGNRVVAYGYDAAGNLTSITPPGRPVHQFAYSGVNLGESYTPPASGLVRFGYNGDRQLTSITRPDQSSIIFGYDGSRVSTVTVPEGTYHYNYHQTSGMLSSLVGPAPHSRTHTTAR